MKKQAFLILPLFLLALTLAAAAQNVPARTAKIKVTAEQANLREKPDIGSSIVQQIPEGAVLEADSKEGEWYFVRFALEDGGVIGGWIHESLVEVVEAGDLSKPRSERPADEAAPRQRPRRRGGLGRIERPEFKTGTIPLEIAVSAGFATLAPRDLNDGTRGYADWVGAAVGIPPAGHPGVLHLALMAGFEVSYRFSPRFALGLGADLLQGGNRDETAFTDELLSQTLITKPSIKSVPVKITARYYPGGGFYARGGFGLYSAKAGCLFRIEGAEAWTQEKGTASSSGLGIEAAAGGEWDLAPRTVLFAEAGIRVASFSGLTGRNVFSNSAGDEQIVPGTLYFFHKTAGSETAYPLVSVRSIVPIETGVVDAREARINISGAAVRVGVRYRF